MIHIIINYYSYYACHNSFTTIAIVSRCTSCAGLSMFYCHTCHNKTPCALDFTSSPDLMTFCLMIMTIIMKCMASAHLFFSIHCKNVMVISTLSGLHLFRGFYNSPHHAVLSGLKWPLHFLSRLSQLHLFRGFYCSPHHAVHLLSGLKWPLHFLSRLSQLHLFRGFYCSPHHAVHLFRGLYSS